MILILLVLAIVGGYLYIYKPEIIAAVLFMLIISRMNFDLGGLPLNARALLTLAVFARVINDKITLSRYKPFLYNGYAQLLLLFVCYTMLVSFSEGLFDLGLVKEFASLFISAYCAYHYFFRQYDHNQLKTGLVLSGILSFIDLANTYIVYGTFPVRRVYFQIAGIPADLPEEELNALTNHNFFGQICGMAFVFILCDYIRKKDSTKWLTLLLPFMFMGVIMSTSRSALIALLTVTLFIFMTAVNYQEQKMRALKFTFFSICAVVIGLLLFTAFGSLLHLDANFVDEIVFRLTEEPVAMLNRALGNNYNVQQLGSMEWREGSSQNAYNAYFKLPLEEQVFGIGQGGFEKRDIGQGFNAHNALLLILIETGIVGLFIYLVMVLSLIIHVIMKKNFSASFAIILFTIIYGLGQNREFTSSTTFLFVFAIVAELEYKKYNEASAKVAYLKN